MRLAQILLDCGKKHWEDVESVLAASLGEVSLQVLEDAAEKVRVAGHGLQGAPEGERRVLHRYVVSLLEAFLGGVDVSLLTLDAVDWLLASLDELESVLGAGSDTARSILREIRDRISFNVVELDVPARPSLLQVDTESLPWVLDELWPLLSELVSGEGSSSAISRSIELLEEGRAVALKGKAGSGRHSLAYLLASRLLEEGYSLYYGDPAHASLLSGKKAVFTVSSEIVFAPSGWSGDPPAPVVLDGVYSEKELLEIAEARLAWEGLGGGKLAREIAEKCPGNPSCVDAASLYLALCRQAGKPCDLGPGGQSVYERVREAVPPGFREALSIPASFRTRSFPAGVLGSAAEEYKEYADRLLLRVPHLGLYSFRSTPLQLAFRGIPVAPAGVAELAYSSEQPFVASWILVSGVPGAGRVLAYTSLNSLTEEASLQALEAVAILRPGTISGFLKGSTLHRLGVLERYARSSGALAVSEELAHLSASILERLAPHGEEYRVLLGSALEELAEVRLGRGLPELCLYTLKRREELGLPETARSLALRGFALLQLERYGEAESALARVLAMYEESGRADALFFSVKLSLSEAWLKKGEREKALSELEGLVKLLVREGCEYAGMLFDAASLLKRTTGKKNYAVCAQLTRCGYLDLAGSYGCFE